LRVLAAHFRASGLEPGPIVGIGPGVAPPRAIALMRAPARGRLTYGGLGRALQMRELRDTSGIYAGRNTTIPSTRRQRICGSL
jgi:hypothetical protein